MTYVTYTTRANDRWDLVAWRFYGDPARLSELIAANITVPIDPVFPAGVVLAVPVLTAAASSTPVPPWIAASRRRP